MVQISDFKKGIPGLVVSKQATFSEYVSRNGREIY